MADRKVKVAVMAGFSTKRDMDVEPDWGGGKGDMGLRD
jgi:hypothetical protein